MSAASDLRWILEVEVGCGHKLPLHQVVFFACEGVGLPQAHAERKKEVQSLPWLQGAQGLFDLCLPVINRTRFLEYQSSKHEGTSV